MKFQDDKRLINDAAFFIRESIFACSNSVQVEGAVGFAKYLNWVGINEETAPLFLRLILTNNPWVIDALLLDREPHLLFATVKPKVIIIDQALENLFSYHPQQIYGKALEALLGIVETAYFDADDGYRLKPISIMDINTVGKFLIKDEPQDHKINQLILGILDRLTHLGENLKDQDKNLLAKHAFNVRYAYFDTTKKITDTIPQALLTRIPDNKSISPPKTSLTITKVSPTKSTIKPNKVSLSKNKSKK